MHTSTNQVLGRAVYFFLSDDALLLAVPRTFLLLFFLSFLSFLDGLVTFSARPNLTNLYFGSNCLAASAES